ncbi:MAG: metallophosphoesterase [Luteolibacter sp.]|uniref:metallophosphoesterase n=1 Tax=Luteolibacter sp. TaxID=1962973 RepID=UPI0032649F90
MAFAKAESGSEGSISPDLHPRFTRCVRDARVKMQDEAIARKRFGFTRRRMLAALVAGGAGALLDAFWFEPGHLTVTRKEMRTRQLPPGLDGLRIGVLSDFHFRPGDDDELVAKAVAQVRREKLDLIALTGDYTSGNLRVVPPLLALLEKMSAAHGVFAVLGNHDGWRGQPEVIRRLFEKAGFSFLINQNSQLSVRGEKLAIAGTDFVWKGRPDPERTLRGISKTTPVVALVHEPDYFDAMTARRDIQLQLSGHTHGGQCRVPLIEYAPRTVSYGRIYNYGHYARGDSNLFVTRGVGTVGVRVRFACPPELAILTLRTGA